MAQEISVGNGEKSDDLRVLTPEKRVEFTEDGRIVFRSLPRRERRKEPQEATCIECHRRKRRYQMIQIIDDRRKPKIGYICKSCW